MTTYVLQHNRLGFWQDYAHYTERDDAHDDFTVHSRESTHQHFWRLIERSEEIIITS